MSFIDTLHIQLTFRSKDHVEAIMPVDPTLLQPHGYLHGGATLSLLESVASYGAEEHTDFDTERPFGVEVCIRHRKSVQSGVVRGVAWLSLAKPFPAGGATYVWRVAAYDDTNECISLGTVKTKVVPLCRLASHKPASPYTP